MPFNTSLIGIFYINEADVR